MAHFKWQLHLSGANELYAWNRVLNFATIINIKTKKLCTVIDKNMPWLCPASWFSPMIWCKMMVSLLLTHLRYCSLTISHQYKPILHIRGNSCQTFVRKGLLAFPHGCTVWEYMYIYIYIYIYINGLLQNWSISIANILKMQSCNMPSL